MAYKIYTDITAPCDMCQVKSCPLYGMGGPDQAPFFGSDVLWACYNCLWEQTDCLKRHLKKREMIPPPHLTESQVEQIYDEIGYNPTSRIKKVSSADSEKIARINSLLAVSSN